MPSQVNMVAPPECSATEMTMVAKTTTTKTGTRRNGRIIVQLWKRSPNATPTSVITTLPRKVRAASAMSLPANALARCTGSVQKRASRPQSRSCGMVRAAPSVPNIPPATAHTGTSPYRLSAPVSSIIDLLIKRW